MLDAYSGYVLPKDGIGHAQTYQSEYMSYILCAFNWNVERRYSTFCCSECGWSKSNISVEKPVLLNVNKRSVIVKEPYRPDCREISGHD
jgi:hypothetical protein